MQTFFQFTEATHCESPYKEWGIIHPHTGEITSGDDHPTANSHPDLIKKLHPHRKVSFFSPDTKKADYARYALDGSRSRAGALYLQTNDRNKKGVLQAWKNLPVHSSGKVVLIHNQNNGKEMFHDDARKFLARSESFLKPNFLHLIESEADDYKGWMSPSGHPHYFESWKEHAENHHPEYLKGHPRRVSSNHSWESSNHSDNWDTAQITGALKQGYVRFGKSKDSIHGFHTFIHYDAKHPQGHKTALHTLEHLKLGHNEPVAISGHCGSIFSYNVNQQLGDSGVLTSSQAARELHRRIRKLKESYLDEGFINFGDFNLEQKFHYYNQLLFGNKVPPCPIVWSDLKGKVGLTTFMHRGRELVPGSMKIEISTRFKRTEEMLNSTLIHEMIHGYLAVKGYPDEQHGFRFRAVAYQCTQTTGITIAVTDLLTDLELTSPHDVETTVLFCQSTRDKQWFGIFYNGTAFDDPRKQNELKAYWGRAGVLPNSFGNNEILVIKVQSSLMTKYNTTRSISHQKWYGVSESEAQDILQHGKILFKIVSGSVSHEDAAKMMPSKMTLVVLRTNPRTNETAVCFYMPNLGHDIFSLRAIKENWQKYFHHGYNVEIFFANTTVFNRGFKMLRDPNKVTIYVLKPDTVAELRRTAQYLERWVQQ
jgi:hypothetical protein